MELEKLDDLYDILEVDFGCSKEDVERGYQNKILEFSQFLKHKNIFSKNQKEQIKNLKIAKYVLADSKLRKMYDLSKIIDNSEEEETKNDKLSHFEYDEFSKQSSLAKKDKPLNYDVLSNRQFERYDHKTFDLNKDREIRGAEVLKKYKNN